MKIVDPHFHAWDLDRLNYPWLTTLPSTGVYGDNTPIRRNFSIEEYLSGSTKFEIVKTVHVEAAVASGSAVDETLWLDEQARHSGHPNGIVAYCDLAGPNVDIELDAHQRSSRLVGIRQILNTHADPKFNFASEEYMDNPRWVAGFGKLASRQLSFDMQIYPHQMKAAAALAARNENVSIVINHTGMPIGLDKDSMQLWRQGMADLSTCTNVSVKISGLGMMFHNWSEQMITPFVRETIELFGCERCMFASNFPVDGMYSSFDFLFSAYRSITSDMSVDEQKQLFVATAEKIYRIQHDRVLS